MRFLIDNALSSSMSNGLNNSGHDAVHVQDLGMERATDIEIMEFALKEDRVIVSADTDCGTLLALRRLAKPSFLLFRQTDKRPLSLLTQLLANLEQIEDTLSKGAIIVIEDDRIRIRLLPVGIQE